MMRAKPVVSITGPMSFSTTTPIAVGLIAAIIMAMMPPREVPMMAASCSSCVVMKSSVSISSINGV